MNNPSLAHIANFVGAWIVWQINAQVASHQTFITYFQSLGDRRIERLSFSESGYVCCAIAVAVGKVWATTNLARLTTPLLVVWVVYSACLFCLTLTPTTIRATLAQTTVPKVASVLFNTAHRTRFGGFRLEASRDLILPDNRNSFRIGDGVAA